MALLVPLRLSSPGKAKPYALCIFVATAVRCAVQPIMALICGMPPINLRRLDVVRTGTQVSIYNIAGDCELHQRSAHPGQPFSRTLRRRLVPTLLLLETLCLAANYDNCVPL